jgi:anhydro-N-acetylmuramic acid kinase
MFDEICVMTYRSIGLMSGSSLDGLDLVFAEFTEQAGNWTYQIHAADCYSYNDEWKNKLQQATRLSALDYQLLHTAYGRYLGEQVNRFINENQLDFKVQLVSSHGHTTFHKPGQHMTAQLGDGAAIAAITELPVVSDLRSLDVAFGGQGAPIVPIGEKLLLHGYSLFLNIGGIANVTANTSQQYVAFDICAANRVMNMLMQERNKEFDEDGKLAATGNVHFGLLQQLNDLDYYPKPYPKSLANDFGTDVVYPLVKSMNISLEDALRTYVEHIVQQVGRSVQTLGGLHTPGKMLVTGGGALNTFLVQRLSEHLAEQKIQVEVPDVNLVQYKEALVMALLGVLRWRQEATVLSSATGASRDSIGGAVWIGQEA